jgi:hypothetical protein
LIILGWLHPKRKRRQGIAVGKVYICVFLLRIVNRNSKYEMPFHRKDAKKRKERNQELNSSRFLAPWRWKILFLAKIG